MNKDNAANSGVIITWEFNDDGESVVVMIEKSFIDFYFKMMSNDEQI